MLTNLLPTLLQNGKQVDVPIGKIEWVGWGAWLLGFLIQALADHQKSTFRSNPANAVGISVESS